MQRQTSDISPRASAALTGRAVPRRAPGTVLASQVGNRRMARLAIARSPATQAPTPTEETRRPSRAAREVAAELSATANFTRRMTSLTQFVHWGLQGWRICDTVVLVAQARNLAAATLAHGSPYWKAIEEARSVAERAAKAQRQYDALDLRGSMPSQTTAPEDWDSAYTLYQAQSEFLWIENDLFKIRSSIEGSLEELVARRKELEKGMEERKQALLFPVTSLVYAEAYLFASAGGQVNERIDAAVASYRDAENAVEMQQRLARACVKTLEIRLRALGSSGWFGDIPEGELRAAPLSGFTLPR